MSCPFVRDNSRYKSYLIASATSCVITSPPAVFHVDANSSKYSTGFFTCYNLQHSLRFHFREALPHGLHRRCNAIEHRINCIRFGLLHYFICYATTVILSRLYVRDIFPIIGILFQSSGLAILSEVDNPRERIDFFSGQNML